MAMDCVQRPSLEDDALVKQVVLARLWSGYGTITRQYYLVHGVNVSVIKKRVAPPRHFVASDVSHVRKMRSYRVERFFYNNLARCLTKARVPCTYPQPDKNAIVMDDLTMEFPKAVCSVDLKTAKVIVQWLANFHASFWQEQVDVVPVEPSVNCATETGIWEEGGYWVLRTRREEFEQLDANWKSIALSIDSEIRDIKSSHLTIIHGDCKAANIMMNNEGSCCALYDFQYVGRGPGVRDLVYLFVSSVSDIQVHEAELLAHYHGSLMTALIGRGSKDAAYAYTKKVMANHYNLCFLDYYRFMLGWGMWGNSDFASSRVQQILEARAKS